MLKELEYLYHKIPDYKITPFLSIKHPTYNEIVEYGEDRYVKLLLNLCAIPDDYKSELYDLGIDWENIELLYWFYLHTMPQLQESKNNNIIFTLDVNNYKLYKDIETENLVLYNPINGDNLTSYHIKLIQKHFNFMIGNMYKKHTEHSANKTVKNILIKEDRVIKRINKRKNEKIFSIKDIIEQILYDKYFENDIDVIKERCGFLENSIDTSISNMVDIAYRYGEQDVIKKIAEEIYENLKEQNQC